MYCHNCPGILTDTGLVIIVHLCLLTQVFLSLSIYVYWHRSCCHRTVSYTYWHMHFIIVQLYVLKLTLSSLSSYRYWHRSCHHCPAILTQALSSLSNYAYSGLVVSVYLYFLTQVLLSLSSHTYWHRSFHHCPASCQGDRNRWSRRQCLCTCVNTCWHSHCIRLCLWQYKHA